MGRPRVLESEKALDVALRVFWQKGYEGTSYNDLTEAIGVKKPALYSAFGNKEDLFRKVLERYNDEYQAFMPEALELPTARLVAERILYGSIELNTRFPEHPGCLVINACLAASDGAEPVRRAVIEARLDAEARLRERFQRAKAEADLPDNANPAALATLMTALLHGLAVQAKAGYSRGTLEAAADQVLANWPSANEGK